MNNRNGQNSIYDGFFFIAFFLRIRKIESFAVRSFVHSFGLSLLFKNKSKIRKSQNHNSFRCDKKNNFQ